MEKLGLSYKNAQDLNFIIDTKLRARQPRFKRALVEITGESFELYFRDILECICALYGDLAFARYLVFAPEQHFSSSSSGNQLYHDMYTEKWWWATQVCQIYSLTQIS